MTGNGARKILCVCLAGLIWCLAGCSALREPNAYPDSNSDLLHGYAEKMDFSALLAKESEVESVGTRSSVLFKNGDRRQMYVFSLPVREERNGLYAVCDTGLYPTGENRFSAENGAYRLTLEESAVYLYAGSDELHLSVDGMRLGASGGYTGETGALSVMPSYSGYVLHYTLEKPAGSMSMTFSGKRYQLQEDPAGYVLFSEEGVNRFIVSQIMAVDRENRVFTEQHFKARRASETYVLTGELPDEAAYPLRVSIGVDVVCDNMFYDASAYEAAPNRNAIFQPVSVFDTLEKKRNGYTYLKCNIRSFAPKQSALLDSAYLNLYVQHCEADAVVEVYSVQRDWCSWTLSWNTRPLHSDKIGEFTVRDAGWYTIDLTGYVSRLIDQSFYHLENNSIMLRIQEGCRSRLVLASTDNKLYPPFFEINYRVR